MIELRPAARAGEGKAAGRRHREIGHARDARDLRQLDLGRVEKQEALGRAQRRERIAIGVAGRRHMRLDLDAIEAGLQEAERQRQRIVAEHVARRLQQIEADGGALVDLDDDLRIGVETGRIAAGETQQRVAVIGRDRNPAA